jgi:D-glycero-D-manno-heptose 1,7-bisphosphate phosphatase
VSAPRLALLDRDGTLNRKPPEGEWITAVDELEVLPGAAEAVRRLNAAGIPVAVVTNQRAIALGRLSEAGLGRIHAQLAWRLARVGAHVDAIYHCPHAHGSCRCRKPEPGLLEAAARDFGVPLHEAVMIGDSASDVEAGRRAGARTVRLAPIGVRPAAEPDISLGPDLVVPDVPVAPVEPDLSAPDIPVAPLDPDEVPVAPVEPDVSAPDIPVAPLGLDGPGLVPAAPAAGVRVTPDTGSPGMLGGTGAPPEPAADLVAPDLLSAVERLLR